MADTPLQPNHKIQAIAGQMAAALGEFVKAPPALVEYIRQHAAVLERFAKPVGLIYDMRHGNALQRISAMNEVSLNLGAHPDQAEAFRKAAAQVMQTQAPVLLEAKTQPMEPIHGLQTGDTPAPHRLPVFNLTDYTQFFMPITLRGQVSGVLQAWFIPGAQEDTQTRAILLQHSMAQMELYLRSRQVSDISEELVRISSYGQFVEGLLGDIELDSIKTKLVEFAQRTSQAARVCLLVAKGYREHLGTREDPKFSFEYILSNSAGQQPPMPDSAQDKALGGLAHYFLETAAKERSEAKRREAQMLEAQQQQTRQTEALPLEDEKPGTALMPTPSGKRPQFNYNWVKRDDLSEAAIREIVRYFEESPMNWATCMPLVDTHHRVCGVLIFEGKDHPETVAAALIKMQPLAYAGGHALATALFWDQRWALQAARRIINIKDGTLDTPKKRKMAYIWGPLVAAAVLLICPWPFKIKANAQVRPIEVMQLPAQTQGRVVAIEVHEGDNVTKGDVLIQLDKQDLEIELRRVENEYLQAISESDLANSKVDEAQMQIARLRASKAAAQMERVQYDIERATLQAPFDGVVIGPKNLGHKLGLVVQLGEPLVEIASTRDWEVKLDFSEQDLVMLENILAEKGRIEGGLKLAADPAHKYIIEITSPEQLAYGLEIEDNEYRFVGVVPFPKDTAADQSVKAGFSGRAAFYVGMRPLGYIWFRDWVRAFRVNWL